MENNPKKVRILSFHHIPNSGAFLFAYSLQNIFKHGFQGFDVKLLNYKSKRLAAYEYAKRYKFLQKIPLFYFRRAQMWNEQIHSFLDVDTELPYFSGEKSLQQLFAKKYDALVVGMDVWCITQGTERPKFPNIYWLPEKTNIPKIAYGVSAYESDPNLIQRSSKEIGEYLDGFDVIGARDSFTYQMIRDLRNRKGGIVEHIPDPAFLYEVGGTQVAEKLRSAGLDLTRPILGLLMFGNKKLSAEIRAQYKARGYQIVALNMYNAAADFNLGHILTPFEWAEAFRYLSFCITDRFHGSIFCLKNKTPFVGLEYKQSLPRSQSKLFDLLGSFGFESLYFNQTDENFKTEHFLFHADEVKNAWQSSFAPHIDRQIETRKQAHFDFMAKIKDQIS